MHGCLVICDDAVTFKRSAYWQNDISKSRHRRSHEDIGASYELDLAKRLVPALWLRRHAGKRIRVQDICELYALRTASLKAFQNDIGMGRVGDGGKRRVYIVPNPDFGFAEIFFDGRFALKCLEHE